MINYTVDAVATAACLMQLQNNYDAVYKYCCIVYTARAYITPLRQTVFGLSITESRSRTGQIHSLTKAKATETSSCSVQKAEIDVV